MSQVIECPSCAKRFRLGDRPPATHTCGECGTVMDLSDFGGRERQPAAAAAPSAPATRGQRRRGAPTARSGGGGGGAPSRRRSGGRPSAARGRAAARRRRDDYDDYEDDYRPRGRPRQSNTGLLLVLGTLGIVVLGLVIALMSKKDDTPIDDSATRAAQNTGVVERSVGTMGGVRPGVPSAAGAGVGDAMANNNGGGADPAPAKGGASDDSGGAPKPAKTTRRGMGRHNVKKFKLQQFPWDDSVDAETRGKVDEAIVAMYRGDRKSKDAQRFLVSQGRKIGSRLVSEFHAISTNETFDSREGRVKAGQIDSTLRKIDGWMERYWDEEKTVQVTTPPDTVLGFAKRWTVWWAKDYWKKSPMEIWDPMVDKFRFEMTDEEKRDARKKRKAGKKGWDKR